MVSDLLQVVFSEAASKHLASTESPFLAQHHGKEKNFLNVLQRNDDFSTSNFVGYRALQFLR